MPPNMSFSHTVEQIRNRTKTVTRRLGWLKIKPGDRFWAVVKAMGLKKGEKVERLDLCECVSNRRELPSDITDEDVTKEGFPGWTRDQFLKLFYRINQTLRCGQRISRIEFKYVKDNDG